MISESHRLVKIVKAMKGAPIVIVGDLVADRYIYGTAGRISREAPVPIIDIEGEEIRPGGAANTAANLASMGAKVIAVGVVGNDTHGRSLIEVLKKKGVDTSGVIKAKDRPTITKTRVMAGDLHAKRQQVIRIDRGLRTPLNQNTAREIAKLLKKNVRKAAAVALSDYGFGIAHESVLKVLREAATSIPVVADSRFLLARMQGMTAVTPNEPECEAVLSVKISDEKDLHKCGAELLKKLRCRYAIITRGNKGMALYQHQKKPFLIPIAKKREAVDVTGAGDTVVAAFTLGMAVGAAPEDAVFIANHAAGVAVLRSGAVAVTAGEIIESLTT